MIRSTNVVGRTVSRAARRLATSDDSGAMLLIALIFITVISVVIAAILGYVSANMRGTVAVRAEASRAAAADGAAQFAINQLRHGSFNVGSAGQCFGPTQSSLPLANFYTGAGPTYSATVTCATDPGHSDVGGGGGGNNRPGQAILTLGQNLGGGEDGIDLSANGSSNNIIVHGKVISNSNLVVNRMTANALVSINGDCSSGTITIVAPGPPKQCNTGIVTPDPGEPPSPTANLWQPTDDPARTVQSVPSCPPGNFHIIDLAPGIYTDLNRLNNLTRVNCKAIVHFQHGTYYFNFNGNGVWTVRGGYLIGGDLTSQVVDGQEPTLPGACVSPVPPVPTPPGWTPPANGRGVQFVFGGQSQIFLREGHIELCANNFPNKIPVAYYGLQHDLVTAGAPTIPAESGCVITVGGCSVLSSDNSPGSVLYIQGTTYTPKAAVDIDLNNETSQVFRFGIVARHLSISATGSPDLSAPVIEVPDGAGGHLRTVLFLQVYVCAGPSACSASGNPALTVKVGIEDDNGIVTPGDRQITVYDWSVQR